uniref:Uncharacterized protein n=1 Tax=Arundo donax TaxID=35708 RepID=A0A0A9HHL1_ARUDO
MNRNTAEIGAVASACLQMAMNEHKCRSQCCLVFHPYCWLLPSEQASDTSTVWCSSRAVQDFR